MIINPALITSMTEWRRHMHRMPECGFDLPLTADFIAEKLTIMGLDVVRHVGQQGIVATLRSGTGAQSIGLRADMDALHIMEENSFDHRSVHDGKMHACGHDGHSAMLLGAAAHLAENPDFDGVVHFIFQPDEEHGRGARAMIDDGLFDRFPMDEVYGLHNMPGLAAGQFMVRPGSLMASETAFEITIHGMGGHAAMPHRGIDPIVIGSQIIMALQTITSRNLNAIEEKAVISATEFITNGTTNVIPSKVIIKGDCRCFSDTALQTIKERMESITSGICAAAGATWDFHFENSFYPTVNHAAETAHAIAAARKIFGAENVDGDCLPLTISEDFSTMLREKPGCYALIGNGTDSVGGCALHNPHYDFNDDILGQGAAYWVQLVQDRLGGGVST